MTITFLHHKLSYQQASSQTKRHTPYHEILFGNAKEPLTPIHATSINAYDLMDHENTIPSERRKPPNATSCDSVIGKIQNKGTHEYWLPIV